MKQYVDVICVHYKNGRVWPVCILWEDGMKYPIDEIRDVRPAASLKNGGSGLRYTCRFGASWRHLFLDDDKWFIERISA